MSCGTYVATATPAPTTATANEIICRGSDPSYQGANWMNFWAQDNGTICGNEFSSILYGALGATGIRAYDADYLPQIQTDMTNAFYTFQQLYSLVDTTSENYNVFQNTLLQTCEDVPGLCDQFIDNYCTGCSRDQVSADPLLLQMCGCSSVIPAAPAAYNLQEASCDPLCNRYNAIHTIDYDTGVEQICSADVCVIDNIAINASNSTLGGGVVMAQMCSSCKYQCDCIIAGVSVNSVLQQVGLTNSTQFNVACGPNSTCFTEDASGNLTAVACPKSASFQFLQDPVNINNNTIWLFVIVGLILVLAIVLIYLYLK